MNVYSLEVILIIDMDIIPCITNTLNNVMFKFVSFCRCYVINTGIKKGF